MKSLTMQEYISLYEEFYTKDNNTANGFSISDIFKDYIQLLSNNDTKEIEQRCMYIFSKIFIRRTSKILNIKEDKVDINNIFLNSKIGAFADFDFLRFNKNRIININFKANDSWKNKKDKVLRTFKIHNRLLNIVQDKYNNEHNNQIKEVINLLVSFDLNNNVFFIYKYDEKNNDLNEITLDNLIKIFINSSLIKDTDEQLDILKTNSESIDQNLLDKLKNSDYLISPLENTEKFMKDLYVLTYDQQKIEDKILSENNVWGISGEAGTGKTLIALDLIKKLDKQDKNILFVFGGNLRESMDNISGYFKNTTFSSAKNVHINYKEQIKEGKFDYIIVDEAQRIWGATRSILCTWAQHGRSNNQTIVFFYDLNQILNKKEEGQTTDMFCKTVGKRLHLTKSIRNNMAISKFIEKLLDSKYHVKNSDVIDFLRDIQIKFFKSKEQAIPWIKSLQNKGYVFTTPTNYSRTINESSYAFNSLLNNLNSHSVIGSQFEKIVTYIDDNFFYEKAQDNNHRHFELHANSNQEISGLNLLGEFYVNLSRATDKLALAVIDNRDVYEYLINEIFGTLK